MKTVVTLDTPKTMKHRVGKALEPSIGRICWKESENWWKLLRPHKVIGEAIGEYIALIEFFPPFISNWCRNSLVFYTFHIPSIGSKKLYGIIIIQGMIDWVFKFGVLNCISALFSHLLPCLNVLVIVFIWLK